MIKSLSSFISGPAGIFVVLFFFLPWITVSCGEDIEEGDFDLGLPSFKVEASGLDLATGNAKDDLEEQVLGLSEGVMAGFDDFDFDESSGTTTTPIEPSEGLDTNEEETALDADPLVWGILLVGIGAIIMAGIRFMLPDLSIVSGIVYILLGMIGIGIQIMKYFDLEEFSDDLKAAQEEADQIALITMSYNSAWWLTMVALFAIIIGGLIALLLDDQLAPQPQTASRSRFDLPSPPSPKLPPDDDELPSWINE